MSNFDAFTNHISFLKTSTAKTGISQRQYVISVHPQDV